MSLSPGNLASCCLLTLNCEGQYFFSWEILVFYRYVLNNKMSFLLLLKMLTVVRMKRVEEDPFDIWLG